MKKVLIWLCVLIAAMLAYCIYSNENIYSREDMEEAIASAEQRGFDNAWAEAKYYARMEIEKTLKEEAYYAEGEIEQLRRERDDAYDAGYTKGYMAGYDDCMEEYGLQPKNEYIPSKKK